MPATTTAPRPPVDDCGYLSDDERLVDRLLESPAHRRERVMNRVADAETLDALRRLWA